MKRKDIYDDFKLKKTICSVDLFKDITAFPIIMYYVKVAYFQEYGIIHYTNERQIMMSKDGTRAERIKKI